MIERQVHSSSYMTETEALMWAAEADPWFSSGMGSLFILDDEPDVERFTKAMINASFAITRLREKVEEGIGIAPPRWVIDDEFDISDHVRHVQLPKPGGLAELCELTARVFQDPFDTSRPLWEFIAVTGAPGRKNASSVRGAIIMKLHHSVSDGIGALRLAEMYLDFERTPPMPEPNKDAGPVIAAGSKGGLLADLDYMARKQLEAARAVAAETALWAADTDRAKKKLATVGNVAKDVAGQLGPKTGKAGSPVFRNRSRHRHLEVFDVSLDELKAASKRLGGSVNDIFVAGSVLGVKRYHEAIGVDLDQFNLSFVMSTRSDDIAGGNAFMPLPFSVSSLGDDVTELFVETQNAMADRLEEALASPPGAMGALAGFASLLPASVLSKKGREHAATMDWATSNLRGAPIPIFTAGAQITHLYPIGPVAGTAFNLTALSYCGTMNFGCFLDPRAVDQPGLLRECLKDAYAELIS